VVVIAGARAAECGSRPISCAPLGLELDVHDEAALAITRMKPRGTAE
jgi:hypothetical protein